MAELRWNPLLKDWVIIASHRQNRPQMPDDWCPFCPGSGKVPETYDVIKYDNDFPALLLNPSEPDPVQTDLFRVMKPHGKCEVILYSSDHNTTLPRLPQKHICRLVDLWCERYESLGRHPKIKYVFIFENRGEVVGVTMPHPHGQIYGYPYIPLKVKTELEACKEHFNNTHRCLICDILREELTFTKRIIFENKDFVCLLPFFTEYPYGMYIISMEHKPDITKFNKRQRSSLASAVKKAAGTLDTLFGYEFPYMMCMHQQPVDGKDYSDYYHFHIEFYPPMRSAEKQKFNASSETGAWAHCNPTAPEEKAEELRQAYIKFSTRGMSKGIY